MLRFVIILVLDTSTNVSRVAVFDGKRQLYLDSSHDPNRHAEDLPQLISVAFDRCQLSFIALSKVVVSNGPGSFTGVRLGIAVAKSIALSLSIPAVGISNLDAFAAIGFVRYPDSTIISMIPTHNNPTQELYVQTYHGPHKTSKSRVVTYAQAAMLANDIDAILVGPGAPSVAQLMGPATKLHCTNITHPDMVIFAEISHNIDKKPQPIYPER